MINHERCKQKTKQLLALNGCYQCVWSSLMCRLLSWKVRWKSLHSGRYVPVKCREFFFLKQDCLTSRWTGSFMNSSERLNQTIVDQPWQPFGQLYFRHEKCWKYLKIITLDVKLRMCFIVQHTRASLHVVYLSTATFTNFFQSLPNRSKPWPLRKIVALLASVWGPHAGDSCALALCHAFEPRRFWFAAGSKVVVRTVVMHWWFKKCFCLPTAKHWF